MKFGLSDSHIDDLRDGQTVEFSIPGLIQPGYNTAIEIELTELDDIGQYDNVSSLATERDRLTHQHATMDNLTETDGKRSIDPDRYDADEPKTCQVCGSRGRGTGDGSTFGVYCPECETHIWIE